MLCDVRLDDLGERERARDPTLATHPLELALQRIASILLGRESATLKRRESPPPVR
jgi:hypothetical protein